jgi:predicted GIY-YIG superfamily endonuclease
VFDQTHFEPIANRIDQTTDGLAYVGNTSDEKAINHNLKFHQFWQQDGAKLAQRGVREPALTEAFEKWEAEGNAEYTIKKLKKWQKIAGNIRKQSSPARALEIYWFIINTLLKRGKA